MRKWSLFQEQYLQLSSWYFL